MRSALFSSNVAVIGALLFLGCAQAPDKPVTPAAPPSSTEPVCTADAKECPDGSFVSREGPHCSFAACPAESEPSRTSPPRRTSPPKAGCTKEAKICPDGTTVGREGPDCEFAECPVPEPVACTKDAKVCPDGSAVGRQGPDCEFPACPGEK